MATTDTVTQEGKPLGAPQTVEDVLYQFATVLNDSTAKKLRNALNRVMISHKDIYSDWDNKLSGGGLIFARLGLIDVGGGSVNPFEYLDTYPCSDCIAVFIVVNGQPSIIKDDKNLFPSDQLITQLRTIIASQED